MLKAVIIDDKTANIRVLEGMIRNFCPNLALAGSATNTEEAVQCIHNTRPDLVFLDIEMPGGDGFGLLQHFTEVFFEVIFVTAYDHYALKAFGAQAIDYLLKPVDITSLQKAALKAEQQIRLKRANEQLAHLSGRSFNSGKMSLPTADGYLFVDYEDITRCTASGSYTTFFLKDGRKILTSMRLKECEEQLPAAIFFRIHHSHLVNLRYISKYVRGRGGYVTMADGTSADVAATKKADFLKAMNRMAG